MKILHTSDWHLGRTLYAKKDRHDEHQAFLSWLLETLQNEKIDILIVAGDVFDSAFPNNTTQKMYYDFLVSAFKKGCRNTIVVGGNHDSPSFLNAPKDLLAALNVTVIGNITENIEDEIIILRDTDNQPEAIICAVPFLRERDLGRFVEGENYADRARRINMGIQKHYEELAHIAQEIRQNTGKWIPIIATGHLSVLGGLRGEDDGVRETYIGNIEALTPEIFPDIFDYVALGHYHIPRAIREHICYSGSPVPIGFDEASQAKRVYIINFSNNTKKIEQLEVPVFQHMASIKGDKQRFEEKLNELKSLEKNFWVDIIYTGDEIFTDLVEWVNQITANTNIEVINIKNLKYISGLLTRQEINQTLEELTEGEIFRNLLEKNNIPDIQKAELLNLYNEILESIKNRENQ